MRVAVEHDHAALDAEVQALAAQAVAAVSDVDAAFQVTSASLGSASTRWASKVT